MNLNDYANIWKEKRERTRRKPASTGRVIHKQRGPSGAICGPQCSEHPGPKGPRKPSARLIRQSISVQLGWCDE